MDILTLNCMLLFIFAASSLADDFKLHPGLGVWWLYWQHRGELTCVCSLVVYQAVPYSM
jgi:hypothetical protein